MLKSKVINTQRPSLTDYFLVIYYALQVHATIICSVEVIYICFICLEEVLYNSAILLISSQLCAERHHAGSLKSVLVGVFTSQKLGPTANQDLIQCFVDGLDSRKQGGMLIMQIHLKNMCVCSPYIVNSPQSEKIIFQSFKHYCPVTHPKSHSMVVVQFLGR